MTQILPAIDLIEGRCVRLTQGDYQRCTTYDAVPEEMVRRYADSGMTRIHVVDLDGAKAAAPQNLRTLEQLARIDGVEIEWGGGLKDEHALRQAFDAGATYAVIGSTAARQPALFADWLERFGTDRLVLGADVREGKVSVSGWQEDLHLTIDELIAHFTAQHLSQVICTEISHDGSLQGPALPLYVRLQEQYPAIDFTVSGGISSMADVEAVAAHGLRRVIIGKAIYEQRITLKELEQFILSA
jgi:phosphoribosylformimino-5-aminoimidazole carboxamide ribotide isomerase